MSSWCGRRRAFPHRWSPTRRAGTIALVLALGTSASPLLAADPSSSSPGNVRFAKIADSAFDPYTQNPTQPQVDWMRAHYARMLAYTPYFDSRLAWFPTAW